PSMELVSRRGAARDARGAWTLPDSPGRARHAGFADGHRYHSPRRPVLHADRGRGDPGHSRGGGRGPRTSDGARIRTVDATVDQHRPTRGDRPMSRLYPETSANTMSDGVYAEGRGHRRVWGHIK